MFGDLSISRGMPNIIDEDNALSSEFFFSDESQANMLIKIYSGEALAAYANQRLFVWGVPATLILGIVFALFYIS
ncbi:hypothetical protein OFN55_29485, partial [Escherichia coli]|nr:hypothetical protein [Escherichia coli]